MNEKTSIGRQKGVYMTNELRMAKQEYEKDANELNASASNYCKALTKAITATIDTEGIDSASWLLEELLRVVSKHSKMYVGMGLDHLICNKYLQESHNGNESGLDWLEKFYNCKIGALYPEGLRCSSRRAEDLGQKKAIIERFITFYENNTEKYYAGILAESLADITARHDLDEDSLINYCAYLEKLYKSFEEYENAALPYAMGLSYLCRIIKPADIDSTIKKINHLNLTFSLNSDIVMVNIFSYLELALKQEKADAKLTIDQAEGLYALHHFKVPSLKEMHDLASRAIAGEEISIAEVLKNKA